MSDTDKMLHYLDGHLSPEETQAFEAHLAQNPTVQQELKMLKRIQTQIGKRPAAPSPGLWAGIEAQLEAEAPENIWPHLVWASKRLIPLMAAAAIILMAVLGNTTTEANTETTLNDYLATQTDLVLSEISATDLVPYTESADQ
ncbi:MAG: anti-sigma factor RsiW [Candidatus Latescibacterota bacterium]|jgi:anti-sigma factor RsiW